MNNKILSIKKYSAIVLATILIAGTVAASSPSFMTGVQAEPYYGGMENNYKKPSGKDISVKSIKCNNINVNVNGLELNLTSVPFLSNLLASEAHADEGERGANSYGSGGSYDDKKSDSDNFRFVCINNNNNTIVVGEEPPVPPVPPEPPITSLTVNKEIFGCDDIIFQGTIMDCNLTHDSPEWISCEDPAISNTIFCQELTENLFDIEVLDDENSQIAQFEGSAEGETIENLEPGTYTVNEIVVSSSPNNQLIIGNPLVEFRCVGLGFEGGGLLRLVNDVNIEYEICFEYEDEQGNDCSTITLAEGEARTCTVKNYIQLGNGSGPSPAGGLTAFDINTDTSASNSNTAGGLAPSFSSPPTIAQGTEEGLSALEKITKLKQQWLDLLP